MYASPVLCETGLMCHKQSLMRVIGLNGLAYDPRFLLNAHLSRDVDPFPRYRGMVSMLVIWEMMTPELDFKGSRQSSSLLSRHKLYFDGLAYPSTFKGYLSILDVFGIFLLI
ncbi:hypothetical protein KP509_33G024100 [Ceratopteris richardii]|uniref:Uncharacterized protein n=1 Tax=Ceratopteris richardii TaxID=49495 RepID=A0A8T2QP70_CERRI|nr:hypothetical protein KP509_33G024100 [Ceratopteris richardii]